MKRFRFQLAVKGVIQIRYIAVRSASTSDLYSENTTNILAIAGANGLPIEIQSVRISIALSKPKSTDIVAKFKFNQLNEYGFRNTRLEKENSNTEYHNRFVSRSGTQINKLLISNEEINFSPESNEHIIDKYKNLSFNTIFRIHI